MKFSQEHGENADVVDATPVYGLGGSEDKHGYANKSSSFAGQRRSVDRSDGSEEEEQPEAGGGAPDTWN